MNQKAARLEQACTTYSTRATCGPRKLILPPARAFSIAENVAKARPPISNCRSRISSILQRNLYIQMKVTFAARGKLIIWPFELSELCSPGLENKWKKNEVKSYDCILDINHSYHELPFQIFGALQFLPAFLTRDEWSHIFQTPLLLRLRKFFKHQLRLLLTLRKLPSNSYQKDNVYFASWDKIYAMAILPLVEHKCLKWSCDKHNTGIHNMLRFRVMA